MKYKAREKRKTNAKQFPINLKAFILSFIVSSLSFLVLLYVYKDIAKEKQL